jgi:hypothetical protein
MYTTGSSPGASRSSPGGTVSATQMTPSWSKTRPLGVPVRAMSSTTPPSRLMRVSPPRCRTSPWRPGGDAGSRGAPSPLTKIIVRPPRAAGSPAGIGAAAVSLSRAGGGCGVRPGVERTGSRLPRTTRVAPSRCFRGSRVRTSGHSRPWGGGRVTTLPKGAQRRTHRVCAGAPRHGRSASPCRLARGPSRRPTQ